jgi:hypothetical protein
VKESDNLYNLIKSLTKTEKAYFKKYASRHVIGEQNKYIALFDAISESRNGYDEKEIKKKLNKEKFVEYFPVMKNYLAGMILKSLNSFYSGSDTDNDIKNDIRYLEILYEKDLYENCAVILNRAFKQAYRINNFILLLELLKWKKNLINVGLYKGNQYASLERAGIEEKEIINKISNLSSYKDLSYKVRSLIVGTNPYYKGTAIKKELTNFLDDPLLQSENKALSLPALHLYYHILADIYDSLGRNVESFECRKKIIAAMEDQAEIIKNRVTNYRNITNYRIETFNLLGSGLNLGNYDELQVYINKVRMIEKKYPGKYSELDRQAVLVGTLMFELRIQFKKGEFTGAVQNMIELEKALREFSKIIPNSETLHFSYLLCYGYFGAGRMNEALDWMNKIINDKDIYKEWKLLVKSKILNLIIHYELGNLELLDYLIKSTYRFLRKNPHIGYDEKIAIEFIKQLPGIYSQTQLLTLYAESLEKLKAKYFQTDDNEPFEVINNFTSIAEFDIISWLESKISSKTFEAIVREKVRKDKLQKS